MTAGLYFGTESPVMCEESISNISTVDSGLQQGCVLTPSIFKTSMVWVLGKVAHLVARYLSPHFALCECHLCTSHRIIGGPGDGSQSAVLGGKSTPTKGSLDQKQSSVIWKCWMIVQAVSACSEDIEVTKSITFLSSIVHNDGGVGLDRESLNELAWPTELLWIRSTKVHGFVNIYV